MSLFGVPRLRGQRWSQFRFSGSPEPRKRETPNSSRPGGVERDRRLELPKVELVEFENLGALVHRGDEGGEEFRVPSLNFSTPMFRAQVPDEVGDVPGDGHVTCHGKFPAGEDGFELAEKIRVQLRFEQGDEVARQRQK